MQNVHVHMIVELDSPWKEVRKALRGLSTTASRSYTQR